MPSPITVTIGWKGATTVRTYSTWTATLPFTVAGASSDEEAIAAVAAFPPGFDIGSAHPDNGIMSVAGLAIAERKGLQVRRVHANYEVGSFADAVTNPLFAPAIVDFDIQTESAPRAYDIKFRPILNTAGSPFVPPPPHEEEVVYATYTRNEPFFDAGFAVQNSNRVNQGPYRLPGVGTFSDGQLLCKRIKPAKSIQIRNGRMVGFFVPVTYCFIGREFGHQAILLNQGIECWYDDSGSKKRGPIVTAGNDLIRVPALLYADGTPFDFSLMVRGTDGQPHSPVEAPETANQTIADESLILLNDQTKNQSASYLVYPVFDSIDFTVLNLI